MSTYFSNFPTTKYQGVSVRDISKRSKVIDDILRDPYIFLPYTVREGEKPEDIAYYYYGSVDDTWIVLLANNITDPYTDWVFNDDDFDQYIINKYKDLSQEKDFDVIVWTQNETIDENILYYYIEADITGRIIKYSPETTNLPVGAIPIRIYEYEKQMNENKREIFLIDKIYRNQIVREFRKSFDT